MQDHTGGQDPSLGAAGQLSSSLLAGLGACPDISTGVALPPYRTDGTIVTAGRKMGLPHFWWKFTANAEGFVHGRAGHAAAEAEIRRARTFDVLAA